MSLSAVKVCLKSSRSVASFMPVFEWSENGRIAPGSNGFGTAPIGKMRHDGHLSSMVRSSALKGNSCSDLPCSTRARVALVTAARASNAVG